MWATCNDVTPPLTSHNGWLIWLSLTASTHLGHLLIYSLEATFAWKPTNSSHWWRPLLHGSTLIRSEVITQHVDVSKLTRNPAETFFQLRHTQTVGQKFSYHQLSATNQLKIINHPNWFAKFCPISHGCTSRCVGQPRRTWGLYQYRWMQLIGTCNLVFPAAFLGSMFRIADDSTNYSTNSNQEIYIICIYMHKSILTKSTQLEIHRLKYIESDHDNHELLNVCWQKKTSMELLGIYVCWKPRYGGGIFNDCQKDSIATRKNPVMFVPPKKWTAHKNMVFSRSTCENCDEIAIRVYQ